MLNDEIRIQQGIEETIYADMPEQSETDYTKADKTDRKINQTYFIVDKQNQKIESVITQIGDRSQKTTTITQDIDGINSKVEQIADLTKTVHGIKSITISDAYVGGYILELHIYGNNTVFDYLYPADDLYPDDTLYPYGDSRIRFYNSKEDKTVELGIQEVLRANDTVRDEVFIDNRNVYLIRRVNPNGTTKTQETKTFLGTLEFILEEGDNTFEIVNYSASIEIKYVDQNDYAKFFATKLEMGSEISQTEKRITAKVAETYETKEDAITNYAEWQQTAEGITSTVATKVGENEIISKINQSSEAVSIDAGKINLNGVVSANDNFKILLDGSMEATNGKFLGGKISLIGGTEYNTNFEIKEATGEQSFYATPSRLYVDTNDGGLFINSISGEYLAYLYNDNIDPQLYLSGNGTTRVKSSGITTPTLIQTSKAERKKNFQKLENGLDIIKSTEIYKYNLKEQVDGDKKHIGFVIGENFKYSHDITAEDNGEEVGVDTYSMISVAYKAIQEQQEQIEKLQEEIRKLKEGE